MKLRTVGIIPKHSIGNQYLNRMKTIISELDEVQVLDIPNVKALLKNTLKSFSSNKVNIIILNWHENRLVGENNKFSIKGLIKFYLVLCIYKLASGKIIFVRHNIYPHGMRGWAAFCARTAINLAEQLCDYKVSHSGHLKDRGYQYIPHPLYDIAPIQDNDRDCEGKYFVAFGRIEKYKRLEDLIAVWTLVGHRLIIAGPCSDQGYLDQLNFLSQNNKEILIQEGFLTDSNAQKLVGSAEALIMVHAEEDMIVSGSFFFAATLGVPIYAKSTPFLRCILDEKNYDGLALFDTVEQIVEDVINEKPKTIQRKQLAEQAEHFFCDRLIREAWLRMF